MVAKLIAVTTVRVAARAAEPLLPEPQPRGRKRQQMAQKGQEVSGGKRSPVGERWS